MRYLVIKRRKSFVGCAMKVKVYIEDAACGDTIINGVSCSRLGTLKNGEEASFLIPEEEAKVFVVGDRLTRNLYNDFCTIPAGSEDVHLSGVIDHNAFAGNPFRFDGVGSADVQENRKRVKKNGKLLLVVTLIVGIASGIGVHFLEDYIENRPRDFSTEGMSITLTRAFDESSAYDFTGMYVSGPAVVVAQKENFDLWDGFEELSVQEYGELAIYATPQAGDVPLHEENGMPWFEYNSVSPENNREYNYLTCMYKADDAFWIVQFIADAEQAQQLRPEFMEYAASVRFE